MYLMTINSGLPISYFFHTISQYKKSQLEKLTASVEKARLNNLLKQKEEGLIGREDS